MPDEKLIGRLDRTRELFQEKLIQLNRDFRTEFDDLMNNLPEPAPPAPAPPVKVAASLSHLLEAVENLHQALSQVELLKALVEGAALCAPRAMLMIKKTGTLHGWAASGFSDDFIDNRLKKVRWSIDQYPELLQVVEGREVYSVGFNDLGEIGNEIERFDGFVPFKAVFYPLVVKNKVAALLYIDSGSDPQLQSADQVQILTHITGLELTLVAAKAKVAPEPRGLGARTAAEDQSNDAPETDSSFVGRMDSPQSNKSAMDQSTKSNSFENPPSFEAPSSPAPKAAPAAPAPVVAPVASGIAVDDDPPAIKKAKRAARVLVSDLMLYNEAAVRAARQSADLYQRLKEDIDRSYQHYKERISDLNSPSERNFFKEEIIRQLGEGNPNVIGPLPF